MKAKEYFDKYNENIYYETTNTGDTNSVSMLLRDMLQELLDICKKRNVVLDSAAIAVAREQNDKWNAISRLFEKKYNVTILKKDGFTKWLNREMAKEQNGD